VRRVTDPTVRRPPGALPVGTRTPNSSTEVTVARQSPGRRNTEEHAAEHPADRDEIEETGAVEDPAEDEDASHDADADELDDAEEDEAAARVTADDRPLWKDVRVDPIEIALPVGSGYTLRAYRPSSTLTPPEVVDREEDDLFASRAHPSAEDEEEVVILDEEFAELARAAEEEEEAAKTGGDKAAADETEEDKAAPDEDEGEKDEARDERAAAEETEDEEVPVFLSHRGKLLLFRTAESLVDFVRSGQPNDMAQIDTWSELARRIEPADVAPRDEDTYELDLVVENLRGGHDTWDVPLLISAGEIARDVGYALRLTPLIAALAPGSPLDDLDEALRKTAEGGLGGFLGRRRLRKIGAQQATLGWRTIIGKISAAVDWRD
jgi:hypothetical protein